jgi:hypothetical protein
MSSVGHWGGAGVMGEPLRRSIDRSLGWRAGGACWLFFLPSLRHQDFQKIANFQKAYSSFNLIINPYHLFFFETLNPYNL